MEAVVYLDTLVAGRLYHNPGFLPPHARRLIDARQVLISPMALLELQYLFEIQRTKDSATVVRASLETSVGLQVCDLPFEEVAIEALNQAWTRDPFDRIIVSHAVARKAPLITKDETILANCPLAVWDGKHERKRKRAQV